MNSIYPGAGFSGYGSLRCFTSTLSAKESYSTTRLPKSSTQSDDICALEESPCGEQDIHTMGVSGALPAPFIEPIQPSLPDQPTIDLSYLMNPCARPAPVPETTSTDEAPQTSGFSSPNTDEAPYESVLPTTVIEAELSKEIKPDNPYHQYLQAIFNDDKALQCEWESYQRLQDANLYATLVQNYNQVYIARADK